MCLWVCLMMVVCVCIHSSPVVSICKHSLLCVVLCGVAVGESGVGHVVS